MLLLFPGPASLSSAASSTSFDILTSGVSFMANTFKRKAAFDDRLYLLLMSMRLKKRARSPMTPEKGAANERGRRRRVGGCGGELGHLINEPKAKQPQEEGPTNKERINKR